MLDELNRKFGLDSRLVFSAHASGLIVADVNTPACQARFFLHGAHLASFRPKSEDEDLIFMSAEAVYEQGKPIRGGVPICFPWFGAHPTDASEPAHGLVRSVAWEMLSSEVADGAVMVRLGLTTDPWRLVYELRFGRALRMAMTVENISTAIQVGELALHTYFDLQDASRAQILGLEQVGYRDQLTGTDIAATGNPIVFDQETDRVYFGAVGEIVIDDVARGRKLRVQPVNSESSVVWNPWVAKSERMADFGNEEYHRMCCVETARIGHNRISIEAGESETVTVTISTQESLQA